MEDRADFDSILDDFLDKYEIVGRKMKPKLEGDTSGEKLDTLRQSLGAIRLSEEDEEDKPKSRKDQVDHVDIWERPVKQRETWDCQTVLSTYSNLENHPAMISDRGKPKKKIVINPKTGMPSLVEAAPKKPKQDPIQEEHISEEEQEEDEEEEEDIEPVNLGVARSKKESKEEKKARKAAVKEAKKVNNKNRKHDIHLCTYKVLE